MAAPGRRRRNARRPPAWPGPSIDRACRSASYPPSLGGLLAPPNEDIQRFRLLFRKGRAGVGRLSSPGRRLLGCKEPFLGPEGQMIDRRHAIRLVLAAV